MISEETVYAVCSFASGDAPFAGLGTEKLEDTYRWPLPKSASSFVGELKGGSRFARTRSLRHKLNSLWQREPELRRDIAKWIVADWGGVRGNKASTLENHLRRAEGYDQSTPFAGVSSYSKILSVAAPESYAILDARVVVSLNAIQVLQETRGGMAFPYIPGRNKITGFQGRKRGFASQTKFSVKELVNLHGWNRVPRRAAYRQYLELLHAVREQNASIPDISTLEMALFSQAEALALRADPSLADN